VPKKIWEDAWYMLENDWAFGDARGKENYVGFWDYVVNKQDLFLAAYCHINYPEETPKYFPLESVWDWDVYTFEDGREAHILIEYRSQIRWMDPKKYDVGTVNNYRTSLGKINKDGSLELANLDYKDAASWLHDDNYGWKYYAFWLDLGAGWYYTLDYDYLGERPLIVEPARVDEATLDEAIVDEATLDEAVVDEGIAGDFLNVVDWLKRLLTFLWEKIAK